MEYYIYRGEVDLLFVQTCIKLFDDDYFYKKIELLNQLEHANIYVEYWF